jgi:RHS repeat-associated protein
VRRSTQTVTATQTFDAFGDQIGGTGSTASALQWQGDNLYATYSADAGLILAGSRYYDPQVGRFITRDADLNQHPYIYCGGDPVNWADPSGYEDKRVTELGDEYIDWGGGAALLGGLLIETPAGGILVAGGSITGILGLGIHTVGEFLPDPGPNPPGLFHQIGGWIKRVGNWIGDNLDGFNPAD